MRDAKDSKPREVRPQLPAEVLEAVHEEWVAHPGRHKIVSLKQHEEMARQPGWWCSGRRGWDETMEPLAPDLAARLAERDVGR